jgi:hypothetical protein
LLRLLTAVLGTKRRTAATQYFGRKRSGADIARESATRRPNVMDKGTRCLSHDRTVKQLLSFGLPCSDRHSRVDGPGGEDWQQRGIRLCHFRSNSAAISLIVATAAVAVLSAALSAARESASDFFECFPRCPGFHSPLILTPLTWRNRLRLLMGEHPSPLYITALQTLQRVVLKARDRDGQVLLYLRHIHFCRAY